MRRSIVNANRANIYNNKHGAVEFNNVLVGEDIECITDIEESHLSYMDVNEIINNNVIDSFNYKRKYDRYAYVPLELLEILATLSTAGRKLIMYFYKNVKLNYNWVKMDSTIGLKVIDGKYPPQYFKAIRELLDNKLVAKSDQKNVYVINHNLFAYGSYNDIVSKLKHKIVMSDKYDDSVIMLAPPKDSVIINSDNS